MSVKNNSVNYSIFIFNIPFLYYNLLNELTKLGGIFLKFKFIVLSSAFILALSPTIASASTITEEKKSIIESEPLNLVNLENNIYYSSEFEKELYLESLEHNINFTNDLSTIKLSTNANVNDGSVTTYGVAGVTLKGLKVVGTIVKHGGNTLSWILKPFSTKVSNVVKKNATKIAKTLAKPEKATKNYIKSKLIANGVSKSDAATITWWLFLVV